MKSESTKIVALSQMEQTSRLTTQKIHLLILEDLTGGRLLVGVRVGPLPDHLLLLLLRVPGKVLMPPPAIRDGFKGALT